MYAHACFKSLRIALAGVAQGLGVVPQTKRSPVQFRVRARARVALSLTKSQGNYTLRRWGPGTAVKWTEKSGYKAVYFIYFMCRVAGVYYSRNVRRFLCKEIKWLSSECLLAFRVPRCDSLLPA